MKRMLLAGLAIAMLGGCQSRERGEAQQGPEGQQPQAQQGGQPSQGAQGAQGTEQPGQQQMATTTGTISQVQGDQITVRTPAGQQVEMTLEDDSQIMMNGQPIQRDRLQQGASVRAAYREEGGEMRVQRLDVQSMGGSEHPGAMRPGEHPTGMQPGQPGQQPGGAQP